MRLQAISLILISLISLEACSLDDSEQPDSTPAATASSLVDQTAQQAEPLVYSQFRDPRTGMIQWRSPIPRDWQVHGTDHPVYITGPGDVVINHPQTFQFAWSPDPFMQQSIARSGATVSPPMPLSQIVELQIAPGAQAQGYRLLGTFDIPGVRGFHERFQASLPDNGNLRRAEALATEWESRNGSRSLIVVVKWESQSPQLLTWTLRTTELEASAAAYEQAKSDYLYALANTEMNPEWIAASNRALIESTRAIQRYWDNATQISAAAHQQRMQAISSQAATSRSVAKSYSDILDISHQGYLSRSDITSRGQADTVNAIHSRSVISNRGTGEFYQVDGDSQYYWVNGDGEYIGTDNSLFDPRIAPLTRDAQWTRFYKER